GAHRAGRSALRRDPRGDRALRHAWRARDAAAAGRRARRVAMAASLFATGIPYPEGPVFLPDGTLVVCARRDHHLVRIRPDGSVSRLRDLPGLRPNGCKRHRDGRLFVAAMSGPSIVALDDAGRLEPIVTTCDGGPLLGPNDLVFGPDGTLYFT